MQFVCGSEFFMRHILFFIHSFIHSLIHSLTCRLIGYWNQARVLINIKLMFLPLEVGQLNGGHSDRPLTFYPLARKKKKKTRFTP